LRHETIEQTLKKAGTIIVWYDDCDA
jgi:hypothetical protein